MLLDLVEHADALIEGFRPGVAERLGFGPEVCAERNPKLVFGRMTGWARTARTRRPPGTTSTTSRLAGVLAHLGRAGEKPTPPINLVGDFGGGGMLLAFVWCVRCSRRSAPGPARSWDAAMVDGARR